jgi:hypothetical protein
MAEPSARDLGTVASDLAYLDREWGQDVDDETIRRNSNVLRILLIDDWYGRAWRAAGNHGEPSVTAIELRDALGDQDLSQVDYAQAGGGTSLGAEVSTPTVHARALGPDEIRAQYKRGRVAVEQGLRPFERPYTLKEYLDSPSLMARERFVSRRLLVKYMANRLGGTHLGASGHKEEEVFDCLDDVSAVYHLAGRPSIHFEVLSIGQTIGQSSDARALRAGLEATASH